MLKTISAALLAVAVIAAPALAADSGKSAQTPAKTTQAAPAKIAIIHARGSLTGARVQLDRPASLDFLVGLFGGEKGGGEQPQHEGSDGQQRNGRANFAEM